MRLAAEDIGHTVVGRVDRDGMPVVLPHQPSAVQHAASVTLQIITGQLTDVSAPKRAGDSEFLRRLQTWWIKTLRILAGYPGGGACPDKSGGRRGGSLGSHARQSSTALAGS